MKKLTSLILCLFLGLWLSSALADESMTVLFTSDVHSWFISGTSVIEGSEREHGGAGRLQTLITQNSSDHTILVDAGDFSMGTLLQAGYLSDAYELRLLGRLGYAATTFGNHEFDCGAEGAATMLRSALASGEQLPTLLIPANLDLTGTLNDAQQSLADALQSVGAARYLLTQVNGIRVAVFGVMGADAVDCAPTSGVVWHDIVSSAQAVVKEIGNRADVIICVSHSGTNGDGRGGEDIDLLKKVSGIDVVISGHTHTIYHNAVIAREGTVLGSCGNDLAYLGRIDLTVKADGSVSVDDYRLIPVDENVQPDAATDEVVSGYMAQVAETYLADTGYTADQVIAFSDFTLSDQIRREEIPLASMIADSYLDACRAAGYDDVEIGIVGMGTVRAPILQGEITLEEVFEVCSLGVGGDGSAGHPLVSCWVTGSDLRLICEMDAFIGPLYSPVTMNYAGLQVEINTSRIPFDRVTRLEVVHADGTAEPVDAKKLYRVCANMYAINMIGSISSKTKGIVKLNPLDANGQPITGSYYDYAVRNADGSEVKEWKALCGLISGFDRVNGIAQIPEAYRVSTGRKTVTHGSFFSIFANPGTSTLIVMGIAVLLLVLIVWPIAARRRKKRAKKASR